MRAIRPIYDGKDDLDYRSKIDAVDMMVCMFSESSERIKAIKDITEAERKDMETMADMEILPPGLFHMFKRVNRDEPAFAEEELSRRGTEFDALIVMFEITRWMKEGGYKWNAVVPRRYAYTSLSLGIISDIDKDTSGPGFDDVDLIEAIDESKDEYVLNVESRPFNELKMLLPLHWAVILLDWDVTVINGPEDKEILQFGNIRIIKQ